jgi:hypothetical protein
MWGGHGGVAVALPILRRPKAINTSLRLDAATLHTPRQSPRSTYCARPATPPPTQYPRLLAERLARSTVSSHLHCLGCPARFGRRSPFGPVGGSKQQQQAGPLITICYAPSPARRDGTTTPFLPPCTRSTSCSKERAKQAECGLWA